MKKTIPFLFVLALSSLVVVSCNKESAVASSSSSTSKVALEKKEITNYVLTEAGVETQTDSIYFSEDFGDVPFVNLSDSLSFWSRVRNDGTVNTKDHLVSFGRTENTGTVTFDFDKRKADYVNLDLFASGHGKDSVLNLVGDMGKTPKDTVRYLQDEQSNGYGFSLRGEDFSVDLTHYNIPMYFENGAGYVPLQTFVDLVLSEFNIVLVYNGEGLYMSGAGLNDEMIKNYYSVSKKNRTSEMARFSRNELALAMDFQYGLRNEHGISDFDTFFRRSGLDDKLLSLDPVVADKGLYQLLYECIGDFHSYMVLTSPDAGKEALSTLSEKSIIDPAFSEFQLIRASYVQARKAVFNALTASSATPLDKPASYEEIDDTAYVTFDNFIMPESPTNYYTTAPTADATDTFGIIEYAHTQIFRENSPVKKVVLDLSCNSGGAINAGMYVAGWFLPYAILNVKNTLTGARGSYVYTSDVNLDGVFDAKDRLIGKGLKLYCLVSAASFSCANFVAQTFKDSDQIRMIGRKTSGGACIVQHLSMADGTIFNTSSNRMLCRQQNGAFVSIDSGVDVDFSIDNIADFFIRSTLTKKIASLY
jgi:hypothetical protein